MSLGSTIIVLKYHMSVRNWRHMSKPPMTYLLLVAKLDKDVKKWYKRPTQLFTNCEMQHPYCIIFIIQWKNASSRWSYYFKCESIPSIKKALLVYTNDNDAKKSYNKYSNMCDMYNL